MSKCYIPENCTITNNITLQNITPLYFAIIGEYISNNKITILDLDNNNGFYETFSKAMLERLSKTNVFFAKMIIYSYFKLVIKYKTINITSFMVENEIILNSGIESLERINETFNELIEINIFVNDSSKSKRTKFSHDKIEEFFSQFFLRKVLF